MSGPSLVSTTRTAAIQFLSDHPKTLLWVAVAGWLVAALETFKVF